VIASERVDGFSTVTAADMAEVDRRAVDVYGVLIIQMMESAGRALARVAQERFLDDSTARRVRVLAGSGGNGGGAMVAARRLHGSAAVPITSPS
jgi:NAD(P)H-hydrate epimerase